MNKITVFPFTFHPLIISTKSFNRAYKYTQSPISSKTFTLVENIDRIHFACTGSCLGFLSLFKDFAKPVFACASIAADIIARGLNIDFTSYESLSARREELQELNAKFKVTERGAFAALILGFQRAQEFIEVYFNHARLDTNEMEFKSLDSVANSRSIVKKNKDLPS